MAPDWLREFDWSRYDPNALSDAELERLEAAFAAFFASQTRRELYDQALARRILLAPCNDAREISEQPQLRFREFFTRVEYPELGASLEHPDGFARSSLCQIGIRRRAPRVGEHNAEVFAELGVSAAERSELARQGVV
jgi:crotonobetainyl-CoA:carnitine CoA-transferase CaiB-like acyl-CoA transferase